MTDKRLINKLKCLNSWSFRITGKDRKALTQKNKVKMTII